MKNLIKLNLVLAALLLAGAARAQEFTLDGVGLASLAPQTPLAVAKASPVTQGPVEDVTIGIDATIRIPFGFVKKQLQNISAKNPAVRIVDAAAPVLVRSGEFLKVVNLEVNAGGIMVRPVLTLKPYFEAKDKLAVKIQKVQLHVSASPDVKAGDAPLFDKEQVMADVMATLIPLIMQEVDKTLAAVAPALKATDLLKLRYDRETWILHAEVSMRFIRQFLPEGLVGDLHLNGFSFNDNTVFVQITTD